MRTENRRQIAQGSLLLGFALTLSTSGFSQSHAVPSSEPRHEASPGHHEIPFQKYRDYLIVVQGSLGDTQRLNFIIDTGTDRTVIDSRVAQKLHMVGVVGRLAVHDQVVEVQQAVLPSVQIGASASRISSGLNPGLWLFAEGSRNPHRRRDWVGRTQSEQLQHRLHNKTDRFRGGARSPALRPHFKVHRLG